MSYLFYALTAPFPFLIFFFDGWMDERTFHHFVIRINLLLFIFFLVRYFAFLPTSYFHFSLIPSSSAFMLLFLTSQHIFLSISCPRHLLCISTRIDKSLISYLLICFTSVPNPMFFGPSLVIISFFLSFPASNLYFTFVSFLPSSHSKFGFEIIYSSLHLFSHSSPLHLFSTSYSPPHLLPSSSSPVNLCPSLYSS